METPAERCHPRASGGHRPRPARLWRAAGPDRGGADRVRAFSRGGWGVNSAKLTIDRRSARTGANFKAKARDLLQRRPSCFYSRQACRDGNISAALALIGHTFTFEEHMRKTLLTTASALSLILATAAWAQTGMRAARAAPAGQGQGQMAPGGGRSLPCMAPAAARSPARAKSRRAGGRPCIRAATKTWAAREQGRRNGQGLEKQGRA